MTDKLDLIPLLDYIDPSHLSYQEWIYVGMGLKEAGYSPDDWDKWSSRDSARYHRGECFRKWESFAGAAAPVTGGTIVQMAKDGGWIPSFAKFGDGHELTWDSEIGAHDELVIIDSTWLEGKEIKEPDNWNPADQIIRYLEILFEAGENVGYVTESWEKDGKYFPTKGAWDRTAGQLIQLLNQNKNDIEAVIGDYNEAAGAWVRFNPLDGRGCKNENVTDFRYALVESDDMELEKQYAIIQELELPVAVLVYSGGKSLHAIVRVEAADYNEYRKRVEYLYNVLKKNGMSVDIQNKNPSRLSRLPGVIRGGKKQFIVAENIGKDSWNEWKEWIEGINDELPDTESLDSVWDKLPELSAPLIDGVLRQGHKMLVAGPSKAGKSYALIELCCAIAEGRQWFGFNCTKGRILYVNLELDRASCLHRFKDVYNALGWAPNNLQNIDIWNLRGKSVPMDKLAPKLIRRAIKKNYIAVIIDPIYKVITGDENSADQMAAFCNQFDKVCTELGCAVIYCHHHSKGAQGGKRSMDRASGSGVFARDPDALLDLIELFPDENVRALNRQKAAIEVYRKALEATCGDIYEIVSQDDLCSETQMLAACGAHLNVNDLTAAADKAQLAKARADAITAWRIEGTLREFPRFRPINLWFKYPVHQIDETGILENVSTDDNFNSKNSPWRKNFAGKKSSEERKKERKESLEIAWEACVDGGKTAIADMAEYMGVSEKTVRNRLKEHGGFWLDDGFAGKK